MLKFMSTFFLAMILGIFSKCDNSDIDGNGNGNNNGAEYLEITLNPNTTYQTIHGFGASDAWSTQFVGKNWPLQKREAMADLLFSQAFDTNGNPKGIGLNTWRFNIGGGSAEQLGSSGINDEWRRAESFLTPNGYNWDAHEGQRWFLKAAQQRGVTNFIGFSNSPPVSLTKNGKAFSSGGSSANLNPDNYGAYADFLVNVAKNLNDREGIMLNAISPFNEPQWDWTGGQEGSPWRNTEIAEVTRILDQRIRTAGIQTKIELTESGQLNYLYENGNRSGRANQIQEFFSANSSNYLGDLPSVAKKIAGHSYYTTYDTSYLLDVRSRLNDQMKSVAPDYEFWMTEYCVLEDNIEIVGPGRDLGIDPALYTARVIHTDLTVANASSWQWWLAISPYDYKDGLVYIDENKNDGGFTDSKLLWALGNYSQFIEEGYQRIGVLRSDNRTTAQSINGLLVSAYKSPTNNKQVIVLVNQRTIDIPIKINTGSSNPVDIGRYVTSDLNTDNLSFKGVSSSADVISIPAKSIVTLVAE